MEKHAKKWTAFLVAGVGIVNVYVLVFGVVTGNIVWTDYRINPEDYFLDRVSIQIQLLQLALLLFSVALTILGIIGYQSIKEGAEKKAAEVALGYLQRDAQAATDTLKTTNASPQTADRPDAGEAEEVNDDGQRQT